jgi:hypothetical protein
MGITHGNPSASGKSGQRVTPNISEHRSPQHPGGPTNEKFLIVVAASDEVRSLVIIKPVGG